jgi:hypothetical protein
MVEMHLAWPVTHVATTSVQVGGAIGLALLATFARERTEGLLADGESAAAALNGGYDLTYLVGVALSLIAMAVALYVLRCERAPETEREPVERGGRRPTARA